MNKILGTRAVQQAKADHKWIRQQRRRPRRERARSGDDRQPWVEICLSEDLSATAAAAGVLVRLSTGGEYTTDTAVEVFGDDDFNATTTPGAVAGEQVVACWLNGQWRALRKSGPCVAYSPGPLPGPHQLIGNCVWVLKDVSYGDCGFQKDYAAVVKC